MKEGNCNSMVQPLVSIILITYNSSKYVLETLESIKAQTYRNLELIVSDDSSTDKTTEICQLWLERNADSFVNATLIPSLKNTGIPSNVNRGLNKAKGEWVKLIAGDDLLLNNCISDNIVFVNKNHSINFLFSKPIYIKENGNLLGSHNFKKFYADDPFYTLTAKEQFLALLTENHPINPPTLFFKKATVDQLGGFDENFENEDFPLYLKVTKAGHKLFFNNVNTVKYRIHNDSFSQKIQENYAISKWKLKKLKTTIVPQININMLFNNPLIVIDIYNKLFFYNLVIFCGNSKKIKNKLSFIRWLSPLLIIRKFKNNKT